MVVYDVWEEWVYPLAISQLAMENRHVDSNEKSFDLNGEDG